MQNPRSSLQLTEWFVVSAILLLLFSFILTAKIQAFRLKAPHYEVCAQVEVTILGHVSKSGCYKVEKGTPLSEVIGQAKPKSYANLLRFSPVERAERDSTYVIEKFAEISVFVEGACEPVELRVPPGTRLCDLKRLLQLHPQADLATFKKRRCLKDKEIVKIALKKVDRKKGI